MANNLPDSDEKDSNNKKKTFKITDAFKSPNISLSVVNPETKKASPVKNENTYGPGNEEKGDKASLSPVSPGLGIPPKESGLENVEKFNQEKSQQASDEKTQGILSNIFKATSENKEGDEKTVKFLEKIDKNIAELLKLQQTEKPSFIGNLFKFAKAFAVQKIKNVGISAVDKVTSAIKIPKMFGGLGTSLKDKMGSVGDLNIRVKEKILKSAVGKFRGLKGEFSGKSGEQLQESLQGMALSLEQTKEKRKAEKQEAAAAAAEELKKKKEAGENKVEAPSPPKENIIKTTEEGKKQPIPSSEIQKASIKEVSLNEVSIKQLSTEHQEVESSHHKNQEVEKLATKNQEVETSHHKNQNVESLATKNQEVESSHHKNQEVEASHHKEQSVESLATKNQEVEKLATKNQEVETSHHKNQNVESSHHKNQEVEKLATLKNQEEKTPLLQNLKTLSVDHISAKTLSVDHLVQKSTPLKNNEKVLGKEKLETLPQQKKQLFVETFSEQPTKISSKESRRLQTQPKIIKAKTPKKIPLEIKPKPKIPLLQSPVAKKSLPMKTLGLMGAGIGKVASLIPNLLGGGGGGGPEGGSGGGGGGGIVTSLMEKLGFILAGSLATLVPKLIGGLVKATGALLSSIKDVFIPPEGPVVEGPKGEPPKVEGPKGEPPKVEELKGIKGEPVPEVPRPQLPPELTVPRPPPVPEGLNVVEGVSKVIPVISETAEATASLASKILPALEVAGKVVGKAFVPLQIALSAKDAALGALDTEAIQKATNKTNVDNISWTDRTAGAVGGAVGGIASFGDFTTSMIGPVLSAVLPTAVSALIPELKNNFGLKTNLGESAKQGTTSGLSSTFDTIGDFFGHPFTDFEAEKQQKQKENDLENETARLHLINVKRSMELNRPSGDEALETRIREQNKLGTTTTPQLEETSPLIKSAIESAIQDKTQLGVPTSPLSEETSPLIKSAIESAIQDKNKLGTPPYTTNFQLQQQTNQQTANQVANASPIIVPIPPPNVVVNSPAQGIGSTISPAVADPSSLRDIMLGFQLSFA